MNGFRPPTGRLSLLILIIAVATTGLSPLTVAEEGIGGLTDIQDLLAELDSDQLAILSELFSISRDIEEAHVRLEALTLAAAELRQSVPRLERELEVAQERHLQASEAAASAVRLLQRLGPASYLDIILGASSLKDFLGRLAVTLSAVRGLSTALARVRAEHGTVSAAAATLYGRIADIEAAQLSELRGIEELERVAAHLEQSLTDLGDHRAFYEQRLETLEQTWCEQARPVVDRMIAAFSRLLETETMPEARVVFSLTGLKLIAPISGLNAVMDRTPEVSGSRFRIEDDRLWLDIPAAHLSMTGDFAVQPPSGLAFQINQVTFTGIRIAEESIELLFPGRVLLADLTPALTGFRLHEVRLKGDELEFSLRAGS